MAKVNIAKPTGNIESLNIISAFKAENNIYVVLDSEKMGSMGLPIIYVSKYTNKLEKINDNNEWQSVKNYLKGIISGTNFEYVKMDNNLNADEAYYTPLTLPQASFDAIKNRYNIAEDNNISSTVSAPQAQITPPVAPTMPSTNAESNLNVNVSPVTPETTFTPTPNTTTETESVMNLIDEAYKRPLNESLNYQVPNQTFSNPSSSMPNNSTPPLTPPSPTPSVANEPKIEPASTFVNAAETTFNADFSSDKETFLKACENMFDALVAKYQKKLNSLEQKEQELKNKEIAINAKLKDANEHLANAEAREQVANIAHDNAQKVMDLNNFMPINPNNNPQG